MQLYLELTHKRATCAYLYTQHQKKLEETKNIVIATRNQISEMDVLYPHLKDEYLDHYKKTCAECGIDQATDDMAVMIRQFIGEDPKLGFEEPEENKESLEEPEENKESLEYYG